MSESRNVVVTATCVHATKTAICITLGNPGASGQEYWIPQSQIHDNSEVYSAGDTGKLIMTRWIARRQNIEEKCLDYEGDDDD